MIDTRKQLSFGSFKKDFLNCLKPVLIEEGVSHWAAVGKWNLDYLREKIGSKTVELRRNQSGQTRYQFPEHFDQLHAAIENNTTAPYLTNANIYRFFPSLVEDVEPYSRYGLPDISASPLLPKNFMYEKFQVELLLGIKGQGFGVLHADKHFMHAFIAQIYGEKEFIIFPPEDGANLYPKKGTPLLSEVDNIWNPDLEKFPNVAKTNPVRVTLKPGNLLFVPSGWWHTTRMHKTSIGVTFNSVSASNWASFAEDSLRLMRQSKPGKAKLTKVYFWLAHWPIRLSGLLQNLFGPKHAEESDTDPRSVNLKV